MVEKEGYEPIQQIIEVKNKNDSITISLRRITKEFIILSNERIRGLIRSSTNLGEIGKCVKESEHFIQLASSNLKKHAVKQFNKTSEFARKRIEELLQLESSTSLSIGSSGVTFSKSKKKQDSDKK